MKHPKEKTLKEITHSAVGVLKLTRLGEFFLVIRKDEAVTIEIPHKELSDAEQTFNRMATEYGIPLPKE